jgi:glycosyltransferase involved in cell wall biosynthesis
VTGLHIAMIGQRGLPASWGGVEHHVEELGSRLVERGHQVTVFCRTNYVSERPREYRGMQLRYVPTVGTKHLDAIVHSALSTARLVAMGVDIVHYHQPGPSVAGLFSRYLSRIGMVVTIHGLVGRRSKWGTASRRAIRGMEWLAAHVPHATITVAQHIRGEIADRYGRPSWYIPNGVTEPVRRPADAITTDLGLIPHRYVLFVGRLIPEKAPDLLLRAFRRVPGDLRLVLAGNSSFTNDYVRHLRALASHDDRVVFAGYVHGGVLEELYTNAALFVLPSYHEGLPLTLLEAASFGIPLIVSDIDAHREIVATDEPGRRIFRRGDDASLASVINRSLADLDQERGSASSFSSVICKTYGWDRAVVETERVYEFVRERQRTEPGRTHHRHPNATHPTGLAPTLPVDGNGSTDLR